MVNVCRHIERECIMTDTKIKIEHLYKIFGRKPESVLAEVQAGMTKDALLEKHNYVLGLNNIEIDVAEKEISVIMGLSGSGKSTLIRHINRLIEPTSGRILVNGQDVLAMSREELIEFRRYKVSMVFQKFGLHVHKTVAENVAYGLVIQGLPLKQAKKQGQKWLERVGLIGFENHYPSQLSGGMQQRVGLARALVTDAEILLMDEPFSALDPLIRTDMQNILLDLQEELHKTIVFITHDLDEALRLGDNIAILRDGGVIQKGTPQNIILLPADEYIFDFIKDINRSRVIEAQSVMTSDKLVTGPDIPHDLILEEALQVVAVAQTKQANVVDDKGKAIGSISLEQIIGAMARPDEDGGQEATRYR